MSAPETVHTECDRTLANRDRGACGLRLARVNLTQRVCFRPFSNRFISTTHLKRWARQLLLLTRLTRAGVFRVACVLPRDSQIPAHSLTL
jgi:hypothetical protein